MATKKASTAKRNKSSPQTRTKSVARIAPRNSAKAEGRANSVRKPVASKSKKQSGYKGRAHRSSRSAKSTRNQTVWARLEDLWKNLRGYLSAALKAWRSKIKKWRSVKAESEPDLKPLKIQGLHRQQRIRTSQSALNQVRLIGKEEHRCPYCLDIVEDADPRGTKTCSICHTRHHADCWAVTGVCQVPHQYD